MDRFIDRHPELKDPWSLEYGLELGRMAWIELAIKLEDDSPPTPITDKLALKTVARFFKYDKQ